MRVSSGTAVVAVALLTGCPGSQSVVCDNGALCREGEVCTENAVSLCGQPDVVAACSGKNQFERCEYQAVSGSCGDALCVPCDPNRAGCFYSGWFSMSSPATSALNDVWVVGIDEAYAAGASLLAYDGIGWAPVAGLGTNSIRALWGDLAVSENGLVYTRAGDGTWVQSADLQEQIDSLSGTSPSHVIAAGPFGVHLFDGVTWARLPDPPSPVSSVWVADGSTFLATSVVPNQILRFENGAWSTDDPMVPAIVLNALWGDSATNVYAVGANKTILNFDGNEWSPVDHGVQIPNIEFYDVVQVANELLIVGDGGVVLRRVGGVWRLETVPDVPNLRAVAGTDSNNLIAVGDSGAIRRYVGP